MLQISEIFNAAAVLKGVARKTSLIPAPKVNPDAEVFLKTENLQLTGSFKLRGAYYKISQLSDQEKAKGVIACSAGNHAQGVALGAQRNGINAVICLPAVGTTTASTSGICSSTSRPIVPCPAITLGSSNGCTNV